MGRGLGAGAEVIWHIRGNGDTSVLEEISDGERAAALARTAHPGAEGCCRRALRSRVSA